MATLTSSDFFNTIQNQGLPSLTLIHGSETFLTEQCLKYLKSQFPTDETWRMMNLQSHYPEDVQPDTCDSLFDFPFFSEYRVVIIRQCESLNDKVAQTILDKMTPKEGRQATDWQHLKLILVYSKSIDKKKKISKALLATSLNCEFTTPYPNQVRPYLDQYSQQFGLQLSTEAKNILMERLGFKLLLIYKELERMKLAFAPIKSSTSQESEESDESQASQQNKLIEIDAEQLDQHLSKQIHSHIFNAIKHFYDRDSLEFTKDLQGLSEDASHYLGLISLVARQARQLLLFKQATAEGFRGRALATKVGLPEFLMKDYSRYSENWSVPRLYELLSLLSESEAKLKSGQAGRATPIDRMNFMTPLALFSFF